MQFLKYVLATIVGLFMFIFLFFVFIIALGSVFGSDEKVSIKSNSVLKLDLNKEVTEKNIEKDPFESILGNNSVGQLSLVEIKDILKKAKTDDNIKGIYLSAEYPTAGWASLKEIRDALIDFKTSKKFIYSYAETQSEKGYYLASVSDKIFLNQAGMLELNGLSANITFYKGMLDKLGIRPDVYRVGKFKSAVEPFLLTKMSDENRKQTSEFLKGITDVYLSEIAKSRGIDSVKMFSLVDEFVAQYPKEALENKIVTNIGYKDQFDDLIKTQLKTKESPEYVSFKKYASSLTTEGIGKDKIAVIVSEGEIMTGENGDGTIGSDSFIKELSKARKDKKVKAIVLRINSPGGSALASDEMYREIELARKEKPVIASLGDYAASGGYYMAMGADQIVAQPTTITGSIGVFSVLFNTEKFFNEKVGVSFDKVDTHKFADFPSLTREMSDFEKARMQASTEAIYDTFTSLAAKNRKMSVEKLREIAGGRVWTGKDALKIGLVDKIGSYDDAIKLAAEKAKLKDYKVKFSAPKESSFNRIMRKMNDDEEEKISTYVGPELSNYVKALRKIKRLEGVQMRMPFIENIQ